MSDGTLVQLTNGALETLAAMPAQDLIAKGQAIKISDAIPDGLKVRLTSTGETMVVSYQKGKRLVARGEAVEV